jgi:LuxR family transcriptional regulator, maltose regulon positive regulatory protein
MRTSGSSSGQKDDALQQTLSTRELEIARLVSSRKSNKEIAKTLGISPRTVSTHLSNIFGKLGVESRGELADLARQAPTVSTRS